jgi:MbtH protein
VVSPRRPGNLLTVDEERRKLELVVGTAQKSGADGCGRVVRGRLGLTNPFDDPSGLFVVLRNADGQHSLWPAAMEVPAGWEVVHPNDTRQACLDYVEEHWADMRPLGLVHGIEVVAGDSDDQPEG